MLDLLIRNGHVLTMNGASAVYENGAVGIAKDTIRYVGIEGDTPMEAHKIIDAEGGLVLPGLVNGHTHAAMTLFRGLADDLPLLEWLNGYIFPAESRMDADFVYTGTLLACAEMILSGTTTFCDMYLFEEQTAQAAKDAHIRCLAGEVLYDFPSPNYGPVEEGLKYTQALIEKWRGDPLISIAVEPHAPFTCSPELLRSADALARSNGVPLIIHLAETQGEVEQIQSTYGRTPVAHLDALGILGPHLIADHCVHLSEADMDLIAAKGVKVVHNPESNMKLASGIAPIPSLMAKGVTVGLGTDGCASNNNLDMFAEMDTTAKIHKVNAMQPTVADAPSVLRMATIESAKALGMESRIGSLEVGKQADVIVVGTRKPHMIPMYNPYSHIVYCAGAQDVIHSIIDGRLVMENRRLCFMDIDDVIDRARRKAVLVRDWISSPR